MTTFHLNADQIAAIARMHAATPATKMERQRTPVLTAVHVHVTPERITATATDRYIVAEHSFPLEDPTHTVPDDGVVIQLPSTDWRDIAKRKTAAHFHIAYDEDGGTVTVEYVDGMVQPLAQVQGNYPPVARIFSEPSALGDVQQDTALNLAYLARLAKITPMEAHCDKNAPVLWQFSQPEGDGKPVTLTHAGIDKYSDETLRALIQPNKLHR